jgi:photosystem II stability/assembly factor-like uncharacterized protein
MRSDLLGITRFAFFTFSAAFLATACGGSSSPPASGDGGTTEPPKWQAFVGAGGTFGQTWDGLTWSTRQLGPWDLFSVTCVGNQLGWTSGSAGAVLHTIDGGQTWAAQSSGLVGDLHTIKFGTPGQGLVGGDAGSLALTTDGGATWQPVSTATQNAVRGVAVSSTGVMLAVGDSAFGLRSVDGGVTWNKMTVPGGGDLLAVTMDPAGHTGIVGDSLGRIFWTVDQGASFVLETTAPSAIRALSITDDGAHALAAGDGGIVFERSGWGKWKQVDSGTTVSLRAALIMNDGATEYVAGDSGTLLQSSDLGASWSPVAVTTGATLYSLDDL